MGVKSLSKYLNQYKAADEVSKDIAKRLIALEESLGKEIRGYLWWSKKFSPNGERTNHNMDPENEINPWLRFFIRNQGLFLFDLDI